MQYGMNCVPFIGKAAGCLQLKSQRSQSHLHGIAEGIQLQVRAWDAVGQELGQHLATLVVGAAVHQDHPEVFACLQCERDLTPRLCTPSVFQLHMSRCIDCRGAVDSQADAPFSGISKAVWDRMVLSNGEEGRALTLSAVQCERLPAHLLGLKECAQDGRRVGKRENCVPRVHFALSSPGNLLVSKGQLLLDEGVYVLQQQGLGFALGSLRIYLADLQAPSTQQQIRRILEPGNSNTPNLHAIHTGYNQQAVTHLNDCCLGSLSSRPLEQEKVWTKAFRGLGLCPGCFLANQVRGALHSKALP